MLTKSPLFVATLIGMASVAAIPAIAAAAEPTRDAVAQVSEVTRAGGVAGDPASWQTDEFNANWGLGAMGAQYAYARGLTGAGVALGEFDSGVDLTHPEFAGGRVSAIQLGSAACTSSWQQITFAPNCIGTNGGQPSATVEYVYMPPDSDDLTLTTWNAHGTHVAGIAAAGLDGVGMHGVSFGSTLAVARFFNDVNNDYQFNDDGTIDQLGSYSNGLAVGSAVVNELYGKLAAQGVRALNFSLGFTMPDDANNLDTVRDQYAFRQDHLDAMGANAAKYGIINVVSAGNDSGNIPDVYGGLPYLKPELEAFWLTVVNLKQNADGTYSIDDSSSICDYTKNWCIAAPGTDITSTYLDENYIEGGGWSGSGTDADPFVFEPPAQRPDLGYASLTGTSMAAPHALGALGLLMERYPYLTSAQVRDVLLTTATDLGEAGVDGTYGWGLINLQKGIEGYGSFRVDTVVDMTSAAGGLKNWTDGAWDQWTNDIGGPGSLTKAGAGWLRLTGDNTFNGATVDAGKLELTGTNALTADIVVNGGVLDNGGTLNGVNVTVNNGIYDLKGTQNDGNVTQNNGTVNVSGALNNGDVALNSGTFNLSGTMTDGNVTQTGGTANVTGGMANGHVAIANGTFNLGGTLTNGNVSVSNGVFNLSGTLTDGDIAATGGSVVVTGTATNNATVIGPAATLSGTGTVGDTTLGGTVSPGVGTGVIGTLNIAGNYVQQAGSTYRVDTLAPNLSDLINVTGTATIAGGSVAALTSGNYVMGQSYNILNADGGVSGQFAGLNIAALNSPFIGFGLRYTPTDVFIDVSRGATFASVATTPNQTATAGALDTLAVTSPLLGKLVYLSEAEALGAFDLLSGDMHPTVRGALLDENRHVRNVSLTRARTGQDPFTAAIERRNGWAVWADAMMRNGDVDGDGNAAGADYDGHSFLVGADYEGESGWRVGALAGAGRTDVDVNARLSSAKSSNTSLGLYGGKTWGALGLHGGYTMTNHSIDTKRDVAFKDYSDHLTSSYDAKSTQAFVEGNWRLGTERFGVVPYLQYAQVRVKSDPFAETGGLAALAGSGETTKANLATAGVRFDSGLGQGAWAKWNVRGGVGYRQASGDKTVGTVMTFADTGAFTVYGAPIARKATIAEIGAAGRLTPNSLLELGYNGQFGDGATDHSAMVRYSIQF